MTTLPILSQSSNGVVLVASPSTFLRKQVLRSFDESGRVVHEASGGAEALVQLENGDWQGLFFERRLPHLDAGGLIHNIKRRVPGIEVVLLDADSGQALPIYRESPTSDLGAPQSDAVGAGDWISEHVPRPPELPGVEPLPGMIG